MDVGEQLTFSVQAVSISATLFQPPGATLINPNADGLATSATLTPATVTSAVPSDDSTSVTVTGTIPAQDGVPTLSLTFNQEQFLSSITAAVTLIEAGLDVTLDITTFLPHLQSLVAEDAFVTLVSEEEGFDVGREARDFLVTSTLITDYFQEEFDLFVSLSLIAEIDAVVVQPVTASVFNNLQVARVTSLRASPFIPVPLVNGRLGCGNSNVGLRTYLFIDVFCINVIWQMRFNLTNLFTPAATEVLRALVILLFAIRAFFSIFR